MPEDLSTFVKVAWSRSDPVYRRCNQFHVGSGMRMKSDGLVRGLGYAARTTRRIRQRETAGHF